MIDAVVIITYPGHFLTTALTIQNIQQQYDFDAPYHIYIDNLGPQVWPTYTVEFQTFLTSVFPHLQFKWHYFSEFGFGKPIWDGWLRQQMIKLNLDHATPGNHWYVSDSDVMINHPLQEDQTPFRFINNPSHLINRQQEAYNGFMLGIDDPRVRYHEKPVFTHHAPFRFVRRETLEGLRTYVGQLHSRDFNMLHSSLMKQEKIIAFGPTPEHMSMTEWDLLELYRSRILQQPLNMRYYLGKHDWHYDREPCDQDPVQFWTFFGTDRDMSRQWFAEQGIIVSDSVWHRLMTIHRT
jgi:hypothetical protein